MWASNELLIVSAIVGLAIVAIIVVGLVLNVRKHGW